MAIKRPSKSMGTPLRRPVASVAALHVDLRARQQMVPGDRYLGWLCKNRSCGVLIAIAPPAGGKVAVQKIRINSRRSNARIVGMRICIAGALGVNMSTLRKRRTLKSVHAIKPIRKSTTCRGGRANPRSLNSRWEVHRAE